MGLALSNNFRTRASVSTAWVKPHTAYTRKPFSLCPDSWKLACTVLEGWITQRETLTGNTKKDHHSQSSQYRQARFRQIEKAWPYRLSSKSIHLQSPSSITSQMCHECPKWVCIAFCLMHRAAIGETKAFLFYLLRLLLLGTVLLTMQLSCL